jgi:hypothetical protein
MDRKKIVETTARSARLQARSERNSKPKEEESEEEDGNESSEESASSGSEFTDTMSHMQNSARDDSTYYPSVSTTAAADVIKKWSIRRLREDSVPEDIIQEFKAAIGKDWNHKRQVDQHGLQDSLRFSYLNGGKGINYVTAVLHQTLDKEELISARDAAKAKRGTSSEFSRMRDQMLRTRRRDEYLRVLGAGSPKTQGYICQGCMDVRFGVKGGFQQKLENEIR